MTDCNRYDSEIINGKFEDEYAYWNKMSEYSMDGEKVYYNFEKAQYIIKFLCDYNLLPETTLEVGAGLGIVAGGLVSGGVIKSYTCTECGDGYIKFLYDKWHLRAAKTKMSILPYPDKSFDNIFLFDVLEHINPMERKSSYKELSRVLKNKRRVFINNPSKSNVSFHNKDFDNVIGFREIEDFADALGSYIKKVEYYECKGYTKDAVTNYYHFIEVSNR